MLISNCNFVLTFTPTITPIIGLKCLVLKALYHCAISFFIIFIFWKIWRFGKFILAKSEPHHAYSCHAYKKKTCSKFVRFVLYQATSSWTFHYNINIYSSWYNSEIKMQISCSIQIFCILYTKKTDPRLAPACECSISIYNRARSQFEILPWKII